MNAYTSPITASAFVGQQAFAGSSALATPFSASPAFAATSVADGQYCRCHQLVLAAVADTTTLIHEIHAMVERHRSLTMTAQNLQWHGQAATLFYQELDELQTIAEQIDDGAFQLESIVARSA